VPLTRPYTLAGLPRLRLRYRALGPHLQLNTRLWDRAPDGTETLVTRGAHRADPRANEAVTELFGNHWRFERGHSIVLEVVQADAPYLRPSTFPATATIDSAELALPGKGG
jgi:predicted acyl esterase